MITPTGRWRPTHALRRGIALTVLTTLTAAVLGTPELVLVAVPFAVGTTRSLMARPASMPTAALQLTHPNTVEGGELAARVRVDNPGPVPLACLLHVRTPERVRLRHGHGHYAGLLAAGSTTTMRVDGEVRRWGSYPLGPATVRIVASDGLLVRDSAALPAVPLSVYPAGEHFDSRQPLPQAAGIVGIHRSRRAGDGGELADVRAFQTGDKLRRINWRVTTRAGTPHVNTTGSERDAEVLLLLDVRREAGVSGGVGGQASVLDATVRAAAALAAHYARQGDRVSLVGYGMGLRTLPWGAGRRHHIAALEWLVRVDQRPSGFSPTGVLLARALQPTSALLVVLTPLLDDESVNLLAGVARGGRPLLAVDTLPERLRPPHHSAWGPLADRLWWLERANTIGRLRAVGVPVERWQGPGSLDLMLRHAHRLSHGPRLVARR